MIASLLIYQRRPKKGNANGTNPPTGPVKGDHPPPPPNPATPPTGLIPVPTTPPPIAPVENPKAPPVPPPTAAQETREIVAKSRASVRRMVVETFKDQKSEYFNG